jgi:murein L,D-transpeptidase YafK
MPRTPLIIRAAGLILLALSGPAAAQAGKAEAPIPAATLALMAQKGVTAASPVLFRAYKKEAEIEVWKKGPSGYVFIKTFPICRWSGQLGPKRQSGDRQTPEGFYTVPRRQMNPNSHYYLSFDVGYPNAYDRAHGGTGSAVMVHGICSSMGCFAMTNGTVGEIYAIARDALKGGQAAFQFQSYPFRMSAEAMARHRTDPNVAFWRELKAGSDRFEASREELQVSVVGGRYAFAPSRNPAVEAAVATRQAVEEARIAALAEAGEPAVRTTYSDGGQNAFWAAYTARGGAVGDVSRPEALAFAGQEVVIVPGHRAARPVPQAVWSAWAAGSALSPRHMAGFVPAYARAADPFKALADPIPTRYGDGLPSWLTAGLGGLPLGHANPFGSTAGLVASAETP